MKFEFKNPFSLFHRARNWYARYERPVSSLALIGGFVFNIFALTRVDHFEENLWIGLHLVVAAACIIFLNRQENNVEDLSILTSSPTKIHFWLITLLQFMFGGTLSTFLVFYFRSAVLSVAWPFLIILVISFIANESLKRHYARLYFQIGFLFLSIFLFAIYLVPVVVGDINQTVFLVSGGVSLCVIILFLVVLRYTSNEYFKRDIKVLYGLIAGIYITINGLYFLDIIPPLPLSLQDAGVYHSIARTSDGNYAAAREPQTAFDQVKQYFGFFPTYHGVASRPVYIYSAVFSPTAFDLSVIHEWQLYDATTKSWITKGSVTLPVKGGRDGGYRTYSARTGLVTGKWRVNVKTTTGQVLGRLIFNVVIDGSFPELEIDIKK